MIAITIILALVTVLFYRKQYTNSKKTENTVAEDEPYYDTRWTLWFFTWFLSVLLWIYIIISLPSFKEWDIVKCGNEPLTNVIAETENHIYWETWNNWIWYTKKSCSRVILPPEMLRATEKWKNAIISKWLYN